MQWQIALDYTHYSIGIYSASSLPVGQIHLPIDYAIYFIMRIL